ncbi:Transcriptional activator protein Anr [BD1-7 clade bacterium]|uniref:Transcriptional activator protein Anr n=1 Tax=BD1-7 clade bacterium TaxID=2029982 RepID=A0A5S9QSW3_9GAMM|nr:Transcriptional activator protein Anr [BD1-7 clade bacterium]CAA0121845.1 Transcriptional activator protein Anr [BD1-7 clade bacterium]
MLLATEHSEPKSADAKAKQSASCPHNHSVSCLDCRMGKICLPVALKDSDIVELDEIVKRGRILQKGDHIFRASDAFSSVYAIRSGYVKTYRLTEDGEEQITGFYFPGEVVGMDGISKSKHQSSAKALESAAVCEIPFGQFQNLTLKMPHLQTHFFQLMSQEITEEQQLVTLLSKKNAEERIATFLLTISARNAARSMSATNFRLPMSRTEMGNFLGLTVETVSRTLSRFAKQHLIDLNQKEVSIVEVEKLRLTANLDS